MKIFDDYNIPVLFTGPHSYDVARIEKWFSRLKATDINPDRLPLGKK